MALKTPCPVCSQGVYTNPAAPMAREGTENAGRHSCVDNGTWRDRTRFGGSVGRLRERLVATSDEALLAWPRVQELKRRAESGESLA